MEGYKCLCVNGYRYNPRTFGIDFDDIDIFISYYYYKNNWIYSIYSRDDSDIDLIVISDDFASLNYWERIDLISEAIYEIFEPIEAVSFTSNEWESSHSFLVDYARDGEVVYAA